MTVAALYVLPKTQTHYAKIPGVDPWPKRRDARLYPGEDPVVAHPPCGPWSRFWALQANPSMKPIAPLAVEQVRRWGGVLEHPALSALWAHCELPAPIDPRQIPMYDPRDKHGGFSIEVEQCWWGHHSRKRTWLYLVGIDPELVHVPPWCSPPPPRKISMRNDPRRRKAYPRSNSDLFSPESRKRTPPAFARWLVDLAAQSGR